jgi:AcrR family transcriptional regulator
MSVEIAPSITVQRPHRADARRNFDALLEAGRAAFAENGSDASLEDIARRAGVGIGIGTLYRNLPTRESLIEALLFMVSGIAGVNFADDAQRERVLSLALAGLRP